MGEQVPSISNLVFSQMTYIGIRMGGHIQNVPTLDGYTIEELGHLRVRISRDGNSVVVVGVPYTLLYA